MSHSFEQLKRFMDAAISKSSVSGIDCIVYQNHHEIFRHIAGYGDLERKTPLAPDALYNIYSACKVITCVAALQLMERGQLRLDEPLSHYLPEFEEMQVKNGTYCIAPAKQAIRIVDLFTMTAGLGYELDIPSVRALKEATGGDFTTRDFARALAAEPLLFEPGEGWNYSYCHDVLAAVIEVITGLTFGNYLKKNIFEPLGMVDSGFCVPDEKCDRIAPQYCYDAATETVSPVPKTCIGAAGKQHESGGGGLITSVADYILFADALVCGGVGKSGQRILAERTIRLMRANRLSGEMLSGYRKMISNPGTGYGLGVATIIDSAAGYTTVPEGAFYWGGLGGVQNLFDPENRLSFFVAQHTLYSPKEQLNPYMWNILYSSLSG